MKKITNLFLTILLISLTYSCSVKEEPIEEVIQEKVNKKEEPKETYGIWTKTSKVDEFGDETDGYSISAMFKGVMSNSATNNANLIVRIDVSEGKVYAQFLEYGSQRANLPDSKHIKIKVKTDSGESILVENFFFQNYLADTQGELYKLILDNDKVKILVDFSWIDGYSKTKYIYEITSKGLKDILKEK